MQKLVIRKEHGTQLYRKHWQFCVGSGHAALAMRADYGKQLKRIHDELGIERVRFHGILNDDMHTMPAFDEILPFPGGEKIRERSFYHVGVAYDNVLAAGMKPFIELSFMPEALAREKTHGKILYGSLLCLPESFELWAEHITEFVKYLIHRYGKEEVETWYFEVWNEPDLRNAFFRGTQEDYFHLYEVTARAIKAVDEMIQVGGPATSGSRWVDDFVEFCREHQVPVDFISTHQYAGDPLTGVKESDAQKEEQDPADFSEQFEKLGQLFEKLPKGMTHLELMRTIFNDPSETDEIPNDTFRKNAAVVREQAGELPVFYTEWNFQAVQAARSNDTRKAAAYIVKTALDIEKNVDGSSVWCFSDIFEEMHQFTEEFYGGFGLQTIHGIAKPTFYALKILSMLAEKRIDLGDHATDGEIGAAAFEDEEKIQILLFRQKMKQADIEPESITVSVEMGTVPKKALLYRIDETHCNPLAVWEKMGAPKDITPKETGEIASASELKKEYITLNCKDSVAEFTVTLGVNDIYMITLDKERI